MCSRKHDCSASCHKPTVSHCVEQASCHSPPCVYGLSKTPSQAAPREQQPCMLLHVSAQILNWLNVATETSRLAWHLPERDRWRKCSCKGCLGRAKHQMVKSWRLRPRLNVFVKALVARFFHFRKMLSKPWRCSSSAIASSLTAMNSQEESTLKPILQTCSVSHQLHRFAFGIL